MRLTIILSIVTVFSTETLEENGDITALIQSVLNVDRALEEEIKGDILRAKKQQKQISDELLSSLNKSGNTLKDALSEQFSKLQDYQQTYKAKVRSRKQEILAEWKAIVDEITNARVAWETQEEIEAEKQKEDIHKLLDQLKMASEKRREQKAVEEEEKKEQYKETWQKVKTKLDEFQLKLTDAVNATKEARKEMVESMRSTLFEIKTILEEQKINRDKMMQQRRDKYQSALNQVKSDIIAQKDDLDALEEELNQKYAQLKQKQRTLKHTIQNALKQSVEASVAAKLGDKLQNAVDKKLLKEMFSQRNVKRNDVAPVATRATILDEVTGVSAWRTVTWILLAICILLSIALIAIIVYQVSQRNKYQLLDGSNHPEQSTPIAKHVIPPRYVNERKASMPQVSSVATVPYVETKQF